MITDNKLRFSDPVGWLRKAVKLMGIGRSLGRYYGVYRGQVVSNDDEEKRGRLRLFIPAIGHIDDLDVPDNIWALPTSLTSGESDQAHGVYLVPDVGDNVWVMFEDGLPHLPIYFTGWAHRDTTSASPLSKGPSVKGFFTKTGHRVEMNDADGSLLIQRANSSTMISMTTDSFSDEVVISTGSGTNVYLSEDKVTVFGKDGSHVSVGEDTASLVNASGAYLNISGSDVNIGASGRGVIAAGAKISLKGSVDLGNGPIYEPAVLGNKMQVAWQAHTHVSTGAGPTLVGSTMPSLLPLAQLSGQVRVS